MPPFQELAKETLVSICYYLRETVSTDELAKESGPDSRTAIAEALNYLDTWTRETRLEVQAAWSLVPPLPVEPPPESKDGAILANLRAILADPDLEVALDRGPKILQ